MHSTDYPLNQKPPSYLTEGRRLTAPRSLLLLLLSCLFVGRVVGVICPRPDDGRETFQHWTPSPKGISYGDESLEIVWGMMFWAGCNPQVSIQYSGSASSVMSYSVAFINGTEAGNDHDEYQITITISGNNGQLGNSVELPYNLVVNGATQGTSRVIYNPCNLKENVTPQLTITHLAYVQTEVTAESQAKVLSAMGVVAGTLCETKWTYGSPVSNPLFRKFSVDAAKGTVTTELSDQATSFQVVVLEFSVFSSQGSIGRAPIQITVDITGCQEPTQQTASYDTDPYNFQIGQKEKVYATPNWAWGAVHCDYFLERTFTILDASSHEVAAGAQTILGITLDSDSAGSFSIATTLDDVTTAGISLPYVIYIKCTVSYRNSGTDKFIATMTDTQQVILEDNCDSTTITLSDTTMRDMETSVLKQDIGSTFNRGQQPSLTNVYDIWQPIPGSISPDLLSTDSTRYQTTICGPIAVVVSGDPVLQEFITAHYVIGGNQDTNYIDVLPTLNSHINEEGYEVELRFSLKNYPSVAYTPVQFVAIVQQCVVHSYELITQPLEIEFQYDILPNGVFAVDTDILTYRPGCDYERLFRPNPLEAVPGPTELQTSWYSWSDTAPGSVIIDTYELNNAGLYTFNTVIHLDEYRGEYNDFEVTFDVELIDTCENTPTELVPSFETQTVHALIGKEWREHLFTDYTDTVSEIYDKVVFPRASDLQIGSLTCGARIHSMTEVTLDQDGLRTELGEAGEGTDRSYVRLEPLETNEFLLTYGSNSSRDKGVHTIQLNVALQNYTSVPIENKDSLIDVVFYHQSTNLQMSTQEYQLGQGVLSIEVPELSFLPALPDDPDTPEDGAEVLITVSQVVRGVTSPLTADLGVLVQSRGSFTIQIESLSNAYLGNQVIHIVYTLQDYFEEETFETSFILKVSPAPIIDPITVSIKPSFDLEGVETSQSAQWGVAWEFDLPPTMHPDDLEIWYSEVELGPAAIFVEVITDSLEEPYKLRIEAGTTDEGMVGSYTLKLQVFDENGIFSEWQTIQLAILEQPVDPDPDDPDPDDPNDPSITGKIYKEKIEERVRNGIKQLKEGEVLPSPPTAKVSTISSLGVVTIKFNSKMLEIPEILSLDQDGIEIIQDPQEQSTADRRLQSVIKIAVDDFTVRVIPGDEEASADDLKFTWQVTQYAEKTMKVQLSFENPLSVSSSSYQDQLLVSISSKLLFVDEYGQPVASGTEIITDLPMMYPSEFEKQLTEQTASTLQSGSEGVLVANIILNFLQGASLQYMWDMINAQQLVILLPLFYLKTPQNAAAIFGFLMSIAAFEAIPTEWIYSKVHSDEAWVIEGSNFETLGFEHHLLLDNFGSLGFVFAWMPFAYLLRYFMKQFTGIRWCRRKSKSIGKQIYWGWLLRIIIESYVIGLVSCMLNARHLNFDPFSQTKWSFANSVLTMVFFPIFGLFPVLGARFMYANFSKLKTKEIQSAFGEIYEGYQVSDPWMILYWLMDFVRKALLSVVVVLFYRQLWLQMLVLYMSSIAMVIANGHISARKTQYAQKMDMFNEAKLIVVMYHLMLFTDFVPDPVTKFQIGYSCCVAVMIGTFVNMIALIASPPRALKKYLEMRYYKQQIKKANNRPDASRYHQRRVEAHSLHLALEKEKKRLLKEKRAEEKYLRAVKASEQRTAEVIQAVRDVQESELLRHKRHEKSFEEKQEKALKLLGDWDGQGLPQMSQIDEESEGLSETSNRVKERNVRDRRPLISEKLQDQTQPSLVMIDTTVNIVELSVLTELVNNPEKFTNQDKEGQAEGDQERRPVKRLTLVDIHQLQEEQGITVDQIATLPGFEDLKIVNHISDEDEDEEDEDDESSQESSEESDWVDQSARSEPQPASPLPCPQAAPEEASPQPEESKNVFHSREEPDDNTSLSATMGGKQMREAKNRADQKIHPMEITLQAAPFAHMDEKSMKT